MAETYRFERLRDKEIAYKDIERFLVESDDEPDPGRQSSMSFLKKATTKKSASIRQSNGQRSVARSASCSNLNTDKANLQRNERPVSTMNSHKAPTTLIKGNTFSGEPSDKMGSKAASASPSVIGKRKRDVANVKIAREAEQIFKNLHFYFFPNNDLHPARRMRIAKAIEFGAQWHKDWSSDITHVIVDKMMDFTKLTKFLKVNCLPEGVAVVSENYPAECISFRTVLEPLHAQFRVKGFESREHTSLQIKEAIQVAKPPLNLKPASKSVTARQFQTPSSQNPSPHRGFSKFVPDVPPTDALPVLDTSDAELKDGFGTAEFDVVIQQARELQHVPLDMEDEFPRRQSSSDSGDTDQETKGGIQSVKQPRKMLSIQDKFQCMQKHTANDPAGPNSSTIAILQQMATYYDQMGDEWRTRAYRKAMGTLRKHPTKVWTKEEALALPQIGDRLATKIEEIAFTSRLRRLDNARAHPADQILQTFMKVYGVGFAKASEWVKQGWTTLDDLIDNAELTQNQRIGIEHFEDFNSRIPRDEVAQHGECVRKALQSIDPAFEVIVGGSYRRGASTSGDIDCLITRPDTTLSQLRSIIVDKLVPSLTLSGFLVAALATTSKDTGSKWHGASCLASSTTWRRIDFLFVPSDELGAGETNNATYSLEASLTVLFAALIYFTGNDIFNRSLRLLASTKGMRLNQRGLFRDVIRGRGREKLSDGTLVEGRDEQRIFAALGVPWRPPEHRIC
ncbi:DNA polymerase beta-like protein [Acrodontium crateriforme]|uniref:DNA polymerase lambda n=1 Tax=Acrodontium crateriforme TaxID=150365 RepID=A0AAQ3RAZ2_9PEZI|nr:DNA polymerase beta-like protein [Acrodontium crateriforme]